MNYQDLAQLLFPHIDTTPEDFYKSYPPRNLPSNAKVTRLGPSPTGFIHLGNLYGAFIDEQLAHQSQGVFYLRIEDTDHKRLVPGAVSTIINGLNFFGIHFDEGADLESDRGDYGPYYQSQRKELYQTFVKKMVEQGHAYPCFLTPEEIDTIRKKQEQEKITPGIYGIYATHSTLSLDEIRKFIEAGKPYVIRLRSTGNVSNPKEITVEDGIRGSLSMPENVQHVVIQKSDGMPTYHFAHVCDDYFMGTTHVVRGEEWLSSLPIHVELFQKLGFSLPTYCHTGVLMKLDEKGNKRKLSKRKDPELSLDYYRELGYHPLALREYLLTILNSNFEEWRKENPETSLEEFPFSLEKISISGALFDLNKLNDVSKDVLLTLSGKELADFFLQWAEEFQPDLQTLLKEDRLLLAKIFNLGRSGNKPRKDLIYASQMFEFIKYFFDAYFSIDDELPEQVNKDHARSIIKAYKESYLHEDNQEAWFEKIRNIAVDLGYAAKPKEYKKHPEEFKGHVGHVSTVIRIALTGRSQSPDIWEIQQILGESKTKERLNNFFENL